MRDKSKTIHVRCTPGLYEAMQNIAQAQDLTVSDIARAACLDYVAPDAGRRAIPFAGVIGQGKDDLAVWDAIKAEFLKDKKEFQAQVDGELGKVA